MTLQAHEQWTPFDLGKYSLILISTTMCLLRDKRCSHYESVLFVLHLEASTWDKRAFLIFFVTAFCSDLSDWGQVHCSMFPPRQEEALRRYGGYVGTDHPTNSCLRSLLNYVFHVFSNPNSNQPNVLIPLTHWSVWIVYFCTDRAPQDHLMGR